MAPRRRCPLPPIPDLDELTAEIERMEVNDWNIDSPSFSRPSYLLREEQRHEIQEDNTFETHYGDYEHLENGRFNNRFFERSAPIIEEEAEEPEMDYGVAAREEQRRDSILRSLLSSTEPLREPSPVPGPSSRSDEEFEELRFRNARPVKFSESPDIVDLSMSDADKAAIQRLLDQDCRELDEFSARRQASPLVQNYRTVNTAFFATGVTFITAE